MKKVITASLLFFASLGTALAQDPGWPRQITKPQGTLVYYQPQVDNWNDFVNLDWRMAFSITPTGGKETVGAVTLHGLTSVNSESQMVLISNLQIKNTYFPSLSPADAASMDQLVRTFVPPTVWISMQRLVSCVPKPATAPTGVQLNNDPPQIFVSYHPAILLGIEGEPQLAEIPHTKLKYVFNTNWPLFLDRAGNYFLLVGNRWLESQSLQGPWSGATKLSNEMDKIVDDPQWASLKSVIPPPPSSGSVVPAVFYSTVPSVVILFDGQPVYAPIQGTQLVYAANTNSYLFVYSPTNQFYYMTAGRWFTAGSLQGPWTFANSNLPADFAHIPPGSPAGQVLPSVPGTEEAKDAVMIAQVPTSITVDAAAAAAKANVSYDGAPQFVPISGTTMSYATNTAQKVIQVGDLYYLCLQGIWFMSAHSAGAVADSAICSAGDLHNPAKLPRLQRYVRHPSLGVKRNRAIELHRRLHGSVHSRRRGRSGSRGRNWLLLPAILLSSGLRISRLPPLPDDLRLFVDLPHDYWCLRCFANRVRRLRRICNPKRVVQSLHRNFHSYSIGF